ncbi:MAG: NAD(P)H-dependent oxidoreductase [Methylococcaceae bacterium]
MKTLLQINSSIFSSGGQSTQLADQFVGAWHIKEPDTQIIVRDLASDPIPHLDTQRVLAFFAQAETRTPEQKAYIAESDRLIDELKQARIIVIGLPMYNFGIPSTLKAYFDQIARAGVTFRYTENGPEGLLTGKKVYIFATRGGLYAGTPLDSQTNYVRDFLVFLGITDVEFIYAEGLNTNETAKEAALDHAKLRISQLTA